MRFPFLARPVIRAASSQDTLIYPEIKPATTVIIPGREYTALRQKVKAPSRIKPRKF